MTEINWGLLNTNPIAQQEQGFNYGAKISELAAQRQAGQQYAGGDYGSAAKTLAASGDIPGAQGIQQGQLKNQKAQMEMGVQRLQYAGKAATTLSAIYDQHIQRGESPQQATQAVISGFDSIAHEIPGGLGSPQEQAELRSRIAAAPQETLQGIAGLVQRKLSAHQLGNGQLQFFDDNTGQPVGQVQGQRNAPPGYSWGPGGQALTAIPGGPGDISVIGRKSDARAAATAAHRAPKASKPSALSITPPWEH